MDRSLIKLGETLLLIGLIILIALSLLYLTITLPGCALYCSTFPYKVEMYPIIEPMEEELNVKCETLENRPEQSP